MLYFYVNVKSFLFRGQFCGFIIFPVVRFARFRFYYCLDSVSHCPFSCSCRFVFVASHFVLICIHFCTYLCNMFFPVVPSVVLYCSRPCVVPHCPHPSPLALSPLSLALFLALFLPLSLVLCPWHCPPGIVPRCPECLPLLFLFVATGSSCFRFVVCCTFFCSCCGGT